MVPLLNGLILLGIDDTLARKRGLKVFGVGMHHDPLLSTRRTAITNWGHCWVVLGVTLKLPFCGDRWFCLPILFRLYVPKRRRTRRICRITPSRSLRCRCSNCCADSSKTGSFT